MPEVSSSLRGSVASSSDDREVVSRVLAGDREAYRLLVERHQRRNHAALWRLTGNSYGRLGAAVLAAWTDGGLGGQWRRNLAGMVATLGLPQASERLAQVVGPADGQLPRRDAITIPLPPPGSSSSSRAAALRDLAATDFGWLLAGVPGGAEALGLAFPDGAASAVDPRRPPLAWLTDRLRPRTFLLAGSMVCLLAAIGLSVSVGGDGGLAGAVLGPEATWRLPAAALSLLLGLVLFVLAERRD